MSASEGLWKIMGKHMRSLRQRITQSISQRGTYTQKLPHLSVLTVASGNREAIEVSVIGDLFVTGETGLRE